MSGILNSFKDLFKNVGPDSITRLLESLEYMWQGMLCIFIVIIVIMIAVYAMGAISAKSAERKALKEQEKENNQQ